MQRLRRHWSACAVAAESQQRRQDACGL